MTRRNIFSHDFPYSSQTERKVRVETNPRTSADGEFLSSSLGELFEIHGRGLHPSSSLSGDLRRKLSICSFYRDVQSYSVKLCSSGLSHLLQ